jgi:phage terminase large subunit-like protein
MRKYPKQNQNLDDLDSPRIELPDDFDDATISMLYKKWALSPVLWMRYFFPHYFRRQSPEFHMEIARNWNLLPVQVQAYEAPRGAAKTTLCEFLTFHSAVFGQAMFVIFISQTEDIAAERLVDIRHECEHNKAFRLFHGDLVSEKWGEKELIIRNPKSGVHCKLLARGLGQQILGQKYLQERPQLIVVDDPEDIKIAENPKNVDKNERWLVKEVIPALAENGKLIMVTTPVTSDCLIERIKTTPGFYFKRYPALTNEGVPLWPEWKDAKALADLQKQLAATGNLYIYFTEYLCNPLSPDKHPFHEDMFGYYQAKDAKPEDMNTFILCDLAIGEKKRNCYSALVVIGVDSQDTWYLLDAHQTKSDWYEFAKDVYAYRNKWNPLAVGVEEAATQKGFWDVLRLTGEKHDWKIIYPIALRPDKDKDSRTMRLLPRFKTHRVRFLRDHPVLLELKKQLLWFPEYKFRDLADCMAYGEIFCYPPGATGPGQEQKIENWRLGRAASNEEMDEECRLDKEKLSDMDGFDLGDED